MPELFHDGSFYHIRPVETGGRGGGGGGAGGGGWGVGGGRAAGVAGRLG